MKTHKSSFARPFIACLFLIGSVLGNVSSSRCDSKSTISVTATVLPKTPQINYRKLQDNINCRIQYYYKKDKSENQGKFLRVTVNLDFPEGSQGFMIEEIEHRASFLL